MNIYHEEVDKVCGRCEFSVDTGHLYLGCGRDKGATCPYEKEIRDIYRRNLREELVDEICMNCWLSECEGGEVKCTIEPPTDCPYEEQVRRAYEW